MGLLGNKESGGGFTDMIRCDEPSYLIWKWHPEGSIAGKNQRENAIRWGSSLRVKEGSVAIFVYGQKDGSQQDYIYGPYDGILETKNLPVLASIVGLAYAGGTPFQAEIYFVNLAEIIQIQFGVPFFDVYDPRFDDFGVPVAVRGTITFMIKDVQSFIKLHRLDNFSIDDFKKQVRDAILKYVKSVVANAPEENGIPVVQLERKILEINTIVEDYLRPRFENEFGVCISSVDISAIEVDKTSEGYKQLKGVTQDIVTDTTRAEADVKIKDMKANQKLGVIEKLGRIITDVKEEQYARHRKTKATDFSKQQDKEIDENSNNVQTPPPIPKEVYNVVINGESSGPYDTNTLTEMALQGKIKRDSLVWKPGMENWLKMQEVDALKTVTSCIPPEIPKN